MQLRCERPARSMAKPSQLIYSFPRWDAVHFGTGSIARYFSRRRRVVAQPRPCDIFTLQSSFIRGTVRDKIHLLTERVQ